MYLGIDCGTQGTKAIVLDAQSGRVLGEGSASHDLTSGPNGRREQSPAHWITALEGAVQEALTRAGITGKTIQGVGISGQQHGLVLLDAEGEILRPAKLWCDTESTPENERLLDYLGGPAGSLERLGIVIAPGYTVSKLLWTKEQHPEVFSRIAHILLPHDYLNYWLTGRCCTEYGDASGTGYFNVRTRDWDHDLLNHIDPSGRLVRALPELIYAHEPVGIVRPDIAARLGLSTNVLVSSGGGDNMMGAIGTGNSQEGVITMSLGTSGTVYAYSNQARVSPHAAVATFCSSTGGWLPLICTMNLTNASNSIRELLALDLDTFNQLVDQAPIGAEGVVMLPFLNGERVPALPTATASILGLTAANLSRANLCRAVVEGVTFGLRYGLDLLRETGLRSDAIRLIGGGAKSPVWRKLVADVMDTPVVSTEQTEAAALGGAIQAAWCHARHTGRNETLEALSNRCVRLSGASQTYPEAQRVSVYKHVYHRYRQEITRLYG
ncbi:xylulokinase [Pseudomonas duriflava]|uniref:Xylulose kinase n=1 Tax=Pseudomonas duriflava TaxID=459528 RepID=A0A562QAV4_9PSED|nr:xylulokinase [Pseudomonas duriflava]TWI53853.1 xylulokinase [Pseudomonas duriflava]